MPIFKITISETSEPIIIEAESSDAAIREILKTSADFLQGDIEEVSI